MVPRLLEVTFLRRDRLAGFGEADLTPVSLPHPLDILANMPNQPPVFLGDYWRDRPVEDGEAMRMLQTDMRFLKAQMGFEDPKDLAAKLDRLYYAVVPPGSGRTPSEDELEAFQDVSDGKWYTLSLAARRLEVAPEGYVTPRDPFFFCTAIEHVPWIKIDLYRTYDIEWIELRNRKDRDQSRAKHFYLRFSDDWSFNDAVMIAGRTGWSFVSQNPSPSFTAIRGVRARHVQVFGFLLGPHSGEVGIAACGEDGAGLIAGGDAVAAFGQRQHPDLDAPAATVEIGDAVMVEIEVEVVMSALDHGTGGQSVDEGFVRRDAGVAHNEFEVCIGGGVLERIRHELGRVEEGERFADRRAVDERVGGGEAQERDVDAVEAEAVGAMVDEVRDHLDPALIGAGDEGGHVVEDGGFMVAEVDDDGDFLGERR